MNMVDGSTLLTTIFVLIDDWYQQKGYSYVPLLPGPSPKFTDSEMLTLLVAMDFFPYPGEQQFLGFVRAYLSLFPKLLDQSQFNRRARRLEGMLEELRRFWLRDLGAIFERTLLLDTKPIPVVGYKRDKSQSEFTGSADYGWCASRKMNYFISWRYTVPKVYYQ